MSVIGVSTSCYYPLETEISFRRLAEAGVKTTEVFFNSPSELEPPFLRDLKKIRDDHGMRIVSVHPFMSFAESFFLFSSYERRFTDLLPFYERFFEITRELGAEYFIFHGAKPVGAVEDERYFDRFAVLTELGKTSGIRVCQENVVRYRSESPDYLLRMAKAVGDDFGVALDVKQARRAGYACDLFLDALFPWIRHVHISDYTPERDCVTPGEGNFDFAAFFRKMSAMGYDGAYIIELYRDSYKRESDIADAYEKMKKILPT